MEPERGDGTRTRIVHTLGAGSYYYDNANFRAKLGQFLGSGCTSTAGPAGQFCVRVTPRVNIGNDVSRDFAVRDSAQVAQRIPQPACGPDFTNNLGLSETKDHCGKMSVWDVASGGRLGMVTGEDATEVANPPTTCTHQCQAQNQVRGRLANLGHPFPVPAGQQAHPADVHQRAGHTAHSLSRHLAASTLGSTRRDPTPHPHTCSARALRRSSTSGRRTVRPTWSRDHTMRGGRLRKPCGPLGLEINRSSPIRGRPERLEVHRPFSSRALVSRTGTGLRSRSGASPHPRRRPTARCAAPRVVGRRSLPGPVSLRRPTFARVRAPSRRPLGA